ncbi:MAG: UDP-N-acetylmuramate dehydrogenase [Patescibacteria group bacterium]
MTKLTDQQVADYVASVPNTKRDEPIAPKTYLKIGGLARLFVVANSSAELLMMVNAAIEIGISFYIFGGGSNILVSDDGYEGVLIQAGNRAFRIEGNTVTAEAGMFTGLLAREIAKAGLEGFEWGIGVPGTMGGAVYGDAGCFGGEMKDVVTNVHAYDLTKKEEVNYSNADCKFAYRESRFKHEPHVILDVTMTLKQGDAAVAQKKLEEIMGKRKETQPQGAFTAGCLFKNVECGSESDLDVARRSIEIPKEMVDAKRIPAGWLIDKLDLKGKTIGKAQVSLVHGNFLVNLGGATASDVIQLSSFVKMKARDELGIFLEDEVQYVGF